MAIVRQIEIENYMTGKKFTKEVTPEQHEKILAERARQGATICVRVIKEREL